MMHTTTPIVDRGLRQLGAVNRQYIACRVQLLNSRVGAGWCAAAKCGARLGKLTTTSDARSCDVALEGGQVVLGGVAEHLKRGHHVIRQIHFLKPEEALVHGNVGDLRVNACRREFEFGPTRVKVSCEYTNKSRKASVQSQ